MSVTESKITKRFGGSTTTSSTDSSTPIKTPTQPVLDPLGAALEGSDPLSQFAKQEMDPFSKMASEAVST